MFQINQGFRGRNWSASIRIGSLLRVQEVTREV